MDFKRRSKDIEIEGHKLKLTEPLRIDVLTAHKMTRDLCAKRETLPDDATFKTVLAAYMIDKWTDDKGKDVAKEEFQKLIIDGGVPDMFVEKLIRACDILLSLTDEDIAFLKKITPQTPQTA